MLHLVVCFCILHFNKYVFLDIIFQILINLYHLSTVLWYIFLFKGGYLISSSQIIKYKNKVDRLAGLNNEV